MKPLVNRIKTALLALLLVFTITSTLALLPAATAHVPAWDIPTYAYIAVTPNPIGVGQSAFLVMWIDKAPPTAGGTGGDRWQGFTVEITKPDGTKETKGPYTSDSTSSAFTIYTPTQVGKYNFLFKFPGQVLSLYNPLTGIAGGASDYVNDTFLPSSASTSLTVQQQPVAEPPTYPLPIRYWTRPIEGQNTEWDIIASNWLAGSYIMGLVQPTGAAPNTPHIMWTKPFLDGGIVGGNYAAAEGMSYYDSLSYETKFSSALIIHGRLYYTLPRSASTSGNGYVCVDLRTGERLFWVNDTMPTFGQLYDYESMNQHGVIPNGYMWRSVTDSNNGGTVHMAYDPLNGNWLFNETNVPSGTTMYGPNGEILIYQLNIANKWLALWNNTAAANLVLTPGNTTNAFQWRPVGKNVNASTAYSWNVTIPTLPTGSTILRIIPDDLIIGSVNFPAIYSAIGSSFGVPTNTTEVVWAISLRTYSMGQLLWQKVFSPPAGNITRALGPVDPVNRIFTMTDKETMQWLGFDLDTGNQLWGPVGNTTAYQYYGSPMFPGQTGYAYRGNLYVGGYGGIVYCYNTKNGTLLWTYGNGGEGNSTNCGIDTPWGNYPTYPCGFADGKIYLYTSEHSPNAPHYKGALIRCLNASTGKEVWTMMSWSSSAFVIADGYAVYLNLYDSQLYCIGKGPSATTVEAPLTAITQGASLTIQGTVTDQTPSPEAKGAPAMSDGSMDDWMAYIYMQKPMPTDATGVQVKLTALDPNGNTQEIGTVTSDTHGTFAAMWTPPVSGLYKIIATFEGSNAYYGSSAVTHISVTEAPAPSPTATPEPTVTPTSTPEPTVAPTATASPSVAPEPEAAPSTDIYIIAAAAAVIIVVAAAAAVILKKRK